MSVPELVDINARRLEGQVALVSGASSGLGRGIARRLAAEGAAVVCGDLQPSPRPGRPLDGDQPTYAVIEAEGGRASYQEWDIRDPDQTKQAIATAIDVYGGLDIVVAVAGISLHEAGPLPGEDVDGWAAHVETNLTGTWHTVRLALAALIDRGRGGRIVTIGSTAGLVAVPGVPSGYGATKAGVIELTRQAAIVGGPHNVTVNCVCPGMTGAGQSSVIYEQPGLAERLASIHPIRRLGTAADIAAAVAFFASPDASWITGVHLAVDGGRTCESSLGDLGLN